MVIDIVFDGPPGPEAGRFVEVERAGKSINAGQWSQRPDGFWALSIPDHEALRSALRGLLDACRYPGEDAVEGFERIAAAFYRDTRMLRPGKSQPDAMNGTPTDEQREAAFKAWVEGRVAAALKALA